MAESFKVLGQAAPAPTVLTDLYTVPALKQTVGSTIVVCNHNAASIKFRVSIAVGGAADAPKQYLYFDALLPDNSSVAATFGLSLDTTDVVRVQTDTASVSFNLFGTEVA